MFNLHLKGQGALRLVYLCNDGPSKLKATDLFVHDKPSIQDLVKAGVINDGRKHLHIGYLSEFNDAMKTNTLSGLTKIRPGYAYTNVAAVQPALKKTKLAEVSSSNDFQTAENVHKAEDVQKVLSIQFILSDTVTSNISLYSKSLPDCHSELRKNSGRSKTSHAVCHSSA